MPTSKDKKQITIYLDKKLVKELEKEAAADIRKFTNYIEWLIINHPHRIGKLKKEK